MVPLNPMHGSRGSLTFGEGETRSESLTPQGRYVNQPADRGAGPLSKNTTRSCPAWFCQRSATMTVRVTRLPRDRCAFLRSSVLARTSATVTVDSSLHVNP